MIAGMILKAFLGLDAIPDHRRTSLKHYHQMIRLRETLDAATLQ